MAVLLYSEILDRWLDRIGANVATDAPFTAAEQARFINEAYADIYEISGGGILSATHTTIWEAYDTNAFSTKASLSPRIAKIVRVYEANASGVTGGSDTAFRILEKVEQERVIYLQRMQNVSYTNTKCYSITRIDETDETRLPRLRLDVFPIIPSTFFPIDYVPQFTEIDASTNTQPSVSDIESRDIALLVAARTAPLIGNHHLVPGIVLDLSERTRAALDRKLSALLDASQDR